MKRKNLIDGLPNSYNTNYVIQTHKCCDICNQLIKEYEISENQIICTEEFDFYHKACLEKNNITYKHYNPKDKSSPIILNEKNSKPNETK
jgi:hypothetical protein